MRVAREMVIGIVLCTHTINLKIIRWQIPVAMIVKMNSENQFDDCQGSSFMEDIHYIRGGTLCMWNSSGQSKLAFIEHRSGGQHNIQNK